MVTKNNPESSGFRNPVTPPLQFPFEIKRRGCRSDIADVCAIDQGAVHPE
jgi:hypothetical protein